MRLGCGCSVTCFAIATPTVKRLMFGPESAIVMDDWFSQPFPSVTLNVRYAAVAPLSAVALVFAMIRSVAAGSRFCLPAV